jgi:hypothetical protein
MVDSGCIWPINMSRGRRCGSGTPGVGISLVVHDFLASLSITATADGNAVGRNAAPLHALKRSDHPRWQPGRGAKTRMVDAGVTEPRPAWFLRGACVEVRRGVCC